MPWDIDAADLHRLDATPAGQNRSRRRKGRPHPRPGVRGSAHDRVGISPGGDTAQAQAVALALAQLPLDGLDLADDHSGQLGRSQRGDARHLDAGVDEAVGRLGRGQVEVDELANPAIRNLHSARESSRKLFEKAQVVFEEQADVVDAVLSMATRSMPMPKAHPVTSSGS